MFRYLSLAVLGLGGLSLASPQVSQAQTPLGVQVQVGPAFVQPGYSLVAPTYVVRTQPVVVRPNLVTTPILSPWFWDGHYWIRRDIRDYRHVHYGYRR